MAILVEPASDDDLDQQRIKESPDHARHMPWIQSFILGTHLGDDVYNYRYAGNGTQDSPYIVDYLPHDRDDAMNFSKGRKWTITVMHSLSTFALTFASSAYASGLQGVMAHFNVSEEVATLGLSLFVLGFAVGPLIWAPLSEIYGRQSIFLISYTGYVAFSVAAACSPNITALLVLRFFASAFGSSSMTNAGAIIADMFSKAERGLATGLFAMAPFLGPALGPIAGGFLGETQGWRWILGLISILGGLVWIGTTLVTRETYAPFILHCRARLLSKETGSLYVSRMDAGHAPKTLLQKISISLIRPWALLFREPIVLLTSVYIAIIYGTLYMFFAGFPIVFQYSRGWSQGISGLPFIGVAIGVVLATVAAAGDSKRYMRLTNAKGSSLDPEIRLRLAMVGSIFIPAGLFLFAWTTYPSVHWIAPVIGAIFFSCGLVMVFMSILTYLVDSYVIYAASVMAANSVIRSLFGTAFPLFTAPMYENLGDQWASSIPAFLALGCMPVPFLFYKYGPQIRQRCKYASQASEALTMMRSEHVSVVEGEPVFVEK